MDPELKIHLDAIKASAAAFEKIALEINLHIRAKMLARKIRWGSFATQMNCLLPSYYDLGGHGRG